MEINKKSIVFVLLLALQITKLAFAQSGKAVIDVWNQAYISKEVNTVLPLLAEDFALAGYTQPGVQAIVQHFVTRYPVKQWIWQKEEKLPGGTRVCFESELQDGKRDLSSLLLDRRGKVKRIDLFDKIQGMDRYQESRLVATLPFENVLGSIVLEVHINGFDRALRLVFDTGADGIVVSQELAATMKLQVHRQSNSSVAGGNVNVQVSNGNTVTIGDFSMNNMAIAIFPTIKEGTDGIIGNAFFKRYITKIDYDKSELSLYTFGQQAPVLKDGFTIQANMPSGIILLDGDLSLTGKDHAKGSFVFDTGAEYNVIGFRPFVRDNKLLRSGFKSQFESRNVSLGVSSSTFNGLANFSLHSKDEFHNMPISLVADQGSEHERWKANFDGSVGVRVLSRYNILINLQDNKITLQPNSLHRYPLDFILGTYTFGWDNAKVLRLTGGMITIYDIRSSLQTGAEIVSINGMTADDLVEEGRLKLLFLTDGPKVVRYKLNGNEYQTQI